MLPASPADFLADDPAPSWLVRVWTCLGRYFWAHSLYLWLGRYFWHGLYQWLGRYFWAHSLYLWLGRAGLLLEEPGRCLFAILLGPAAKETHGVIVDR